ncbi:S8 family serine peptidase [Streptomyces sp. NPDC006012]|uniref:S8 family serine peptidase n=1 Tax=Streptomyces sp. NPDC006012 TaxID=3364739 RepID=UPI0036CA3D13
MSHARPRGRRLAAAAAAIAALTAGALTVPATAASPVPSAPRTGEPPSASGKAAVGGSTLTEPPAQKQGVVPGQVLLTLDEGTSVTGHPVSGSSVAARAAQTSDPGLNAELRAVGATSLHPLLPSAGSATTDQLTSAARVEPGASAADLPHTYVVRTRQKDSAAVARSLAAAPGVADAEPNRYVNTMSTVAEPVPSADLKAAAAATSRATRSGPSSESGSTAPADLDGVPANYALTDSAQGMLNAGGVDATGAFSLLKKEYGQTPGQGEVITNVSVGDLTDQSMADAGDSYVASFGPTTVLRNGRRYLDLPSMPLIPTYVAAADGSLSGSASTKQQDPLLDEVLLDFSVMAPLPHDQQRPDRTGSGYTDLLGIAPGADYRLVVPQTPTMDQIAVALLAAAQQKPRPDVITASLGYGTDSIGFPGRYLEDDPYIRSIISAIVHTYHVVVSISSNDGTRLYTPASVGPDGGSTPTEVTGNGSAATSIDDDAESTVPTVVPDSGAIAVGGTTLDDTLAAPAGSAQSAGATVAETRISGSGTFSSGFGSRIDLSAPSDGIVAFQHTTGQGPQAVTPVLNGGTSASAPEVAAAAAVVLQAGRLAGHDLTPAQVRSLLERTGRAVPTPPQIDRPLHVGPQIDVTAAAEAALGDTAGPSLVRLSMAHRVTRGALGGSFLETTDPGRIDLADSASGGTGEGLVGPVTFAGDVTGLPKDAKAQYTLTVGATVFRSGTPAIRVTPKQLLDAAGLPEVSATDRTLKATYRVLTDGRVRADAQRTITVGPSDGTYVEATAPNAPAVARTGKAVTVSYDISGVSRTDAPQLVVSTVGHWNPVLGQIFTAGWHQALTAQQGTITAPADAFSGGGGLYGIGIAQSGYGGDPTKVVYGEFAPIRIDGGSAAVRPAAPVLTGSDRVAGHFAEVTRSAPSFGLTHDVTGIRGAKSAVAEFSAPGPTLYNSLNTFTNANGTAYDGDGVNTPSTARVTLSGKKGTERLDALALGPATSASYGVRILALDGLGHVVGQASPLSTLQVDDGLAPDGSTVLSFAAAGDDSIAALRTAAGGTEVRHYSTKTGGYGAVLASDTGTGSDYEVLGVAPGSRRVLLAHRSTSDGDVQVETWNTATDSPAGRFTLRAADHTFVTGQVDAGHGRAALLLRSAADDSDLVQSVDLSDGSAGTLLEADPDGVRPGSYSLMTIDRSSGEVFLAKQAT